jgi:hypothetical protein
MHGGDQMLGWAVKQQGQTVCHHDGARHASVEGETSVCQLSVRGIVVQLRHHAAMDLAHEHGSHWQLLRQQLSVIEHRLRVVTHVVA